MPVPIEEASAFGVMAVDENDKIIEFVEKPPTRQRCRAMPPNRWPAWGSMSLTRLSL
jgi:glucose-1-phosphate adenylyltransferase